MINGADDPDGRDFKSMLARVSPMGWGRCALAGAVMQVFAASGAAAAEPKRALQLLHSFAKEVAPLQP
jgi:hypothetical protein